MIRNVAIIGLGLIGGSLGLALKRNEAIRIIGFDNSETTLKEAFEKGAIDSIACTAKSAAEQADVIIFATPVNTTVNLLSEALSWGLKEDVIITDTGSTKRPIMKAAQKLVEKGVVVIGGHPMAGSHKSGIAAAQAHLFENAYYILTPSKGVKDKKIEQIRNLLTTTKGKLMLLEADEHDSMTAIISHFPHIVASSLVTRLARQQEKHPFLTNLAAGGFRDITRIASADPIMWRDVTIQNRDELLKQLDGWLQSMNEVRDMLLTHDELEIYRFFAEAKEYRDNLPATYKGAVQGALYTTFDLHVDIPDHPGVISEVTKILADERISLTNIRIVETRTDVYGILVISFQTSDDRKKAKDVLGRQTEYSMQIL